MPKLRLENITKRFPGVKALQNVSIEINPGEVHALCGENGAGKSTLMNVLAGNIRPDTGSISLDGAKISIDNPQQAFANNIAIVYQHLSLVDSLSVAENIYANRQPINRMGLIRFDALHEDTVELLKQLDIPEIDPDKIVAHLSPPERQMVEIAKALARRPSTLILDEPTASLTIKETRKLFEILKNLKRDGISIIYISHRLEEIFELADRVSILKDGKFQGTFNVTELTKEVLISKMVGRDLQIKETSSSKSESVLLTVDNISGSKFSNVSFHLHCGEIVGLAGLVGAGRTEIARAIFGIDKLSSGQIRLRNISFRASHPSSAIRAGLAYLTEDRKTEGLFQEMSVAENIVAASLSSIQTSGLYDKSKETRCALEFMGKLRITAADTRQRVVNLSGGNQQKVMLAKWLLCQPEVLIIDEPTHGIDVGAKYEIYELLKSLTIKGKGILMISSELPELVGLCDRIIVIKKGSVAGELTGEDMTEQNVIRLAT